MKVYEPWHSYLLMRIEHRNFLSTHADGTKQKSFEFEQ
jgi:hypothetical protein